MAEKTILWQSIKELQAQEQLFFDRNGQNVGSSQKEFPQYFPKSWLGRTQCQ